MSNTSPNWARRFSRIITVVAIVVALMIFLGRREIMGTRYKVSEKESVNYSGKATEEDARKLGETLKEIGFFNGSRSADVLLRRDEKKGAILSFIVSKWGDAETQANFHQVGTVLADRALGRPITLRLIDNKLNTRHEMRIE